MGYGVVTYLNKTDVQTHVVNLIMCYRIYLQ